MIRTSRWLQVRLGPLHPAWGGPSAGAPPPHPGWTALLFPLTLAWTLPQTLAGLLYALWARGRGCPWFLYRFGPCLFLVVPGVPWFLRGISLGAVVLADRPDVLTHEFCHVYTAAWLGWLYLPVYGLEYLLLGHDRSPHERLTCWLTARTRWAWQRLD